MRAVLAFALLGAAFAFAPVALQSTDIKFNLQAKTPFATRASLQAVPPTPAGISTACSTGLMNMMNMSMDTSNVCAQIGMQIGDVKATAANMTYFCTNCASGYQAALDALMAACTPADRLILMNSNDRYYSDFIPRSRFQAAVYCVKDGDTFCFPKIASQFMNGYFTGSNTTALDIMCPGTCLDQVMTAAQMYASGETRQSLNIVKLSCRKESGEYCLARMVANQAQIGTAFQTIFGSGAAVEPTDADLATACHPCTMIAFNGLAGLAGNGNVDGVSPAIISLGGLVRAVCTKDESGAFCGKKTPAFFQKFSDATIQANLDSCCEDAAKTICPGASNFTGTMCPASCKSGVSALGSGMGCCFRTFYEGMTSLMPAGSDAPSVAKIFDWARDACGQPFSACARKFVAVKFMIRNLKYAYVTANKEAIYAKVIADIATRLLLDTTSVTITGIEDVVSPSSTITVQAGVGSVRFSATISPPTDAQAATMNSDIAATPLTFPSLTDLPISARADATQDITTDTSAQSTDVQSSSASKLSFSLFALVALFLARLF